MKAIARQGDELYIILEDKDEGKVYSAVTGEMGPVTDLQVLFKWGFWEEGEFEVDVMLQEEQGD